MNVFPILLKPYVIAIKNDLKREYAERFWNRTTFAILFVSLILLGMSELSLSFFTKLKQADVFTAELLTNFISLSLLALFSVTTFSAIISATSSLYSSKDLSLHLVCPIPLRTIFIAKLLHVTLLSTWMFSLVMLTFGIGLIQSFDISYFNLLLWAPGLVLFGMIPSALGILAVIIVANVFPADRLREVAVLIVVVGLMSLILYDQEVALSTKMPDSISRAITMAKKFSRGNIWWYPNSLYASIITGAIYSGTVLCWEYLFLLFETVLLSLVVFFLFNRLFLRGWAKSTNSNVQRISYKAGYSRKMGDLIFRKPSPLRAVMGKEFRTFIRDTTQSVQLLLLLTLTFIYLYNFRVIQSSSIVEGSYREAWQAILSSANILFAGCVLVAVCTRFVYPCISLEGSSYDIIMATPIGIRSFLKCKFLTWFIPVSTLSFILLISGGLAIQADISSLVGMSIISICLGASLVALGIGIGAYYAKFDWETPIQVSSNFGSLVYMMLAMTVVVLNLVPASIFFVFSNVSFFKERLMLIDLSFAHICCLFLVVIMNGSIIRRALIAGETKLSERNS